MLRKKWCLYSLSNLLSVVLFWIIQSLEKMLLTCFNVLRQSTNNKTSNNCEQLHLGTDEYFLQFFNLLLYTNYLIREVFCLFASKRVFPEVFYWLMENRSIDSFHINISVLKISIKLKYGSNSSTHIVRDLNESTEIIEDHLSVTVSQIFQINNFRIARARYNDKRVLILSHIYLYVEVVDCQHKFILELLVEFTFQENGQNAMLKDPTLFLCKVSTIKIFWKFGMLLSSTQ